MATAAAAAGGDDDIFDGEKETTVRSAGDDGSRTNKAEGTSAAPTSDGALGATLLVEYRAAEEFFGGLPGEEKAGGGPNPNGFEATVADVSAQKRRDCDAGVASGRSENRRGEHETVPAGVGGGHPPPRNKKRNRVTPLGAGELNSQPPAVMAKTGSAKKGEVAATGGISARGDGCHNLGGGSSASGGGGGGGGSVALRKKSIDAGVQCARPPETSDTLAGGLGSRGNCGCLVM